MTIGWCREQCARLISVLVVSLGVAATAAGQSSTGAGGRVFGLVGGGFGGLYAAKDLDPLFACNPVIQRLADAADHEQPGVRNLLPRRRPYFFEQEVNRIDIPGMHGAHEERVGAH